MTSDLIPSDVSEWPANDEGKKYRRTMIVSGDPGALPSDVGPANPLPVTDYLTEVQLGNVTGHRFIEAFGERSGAGNTEGEDVWRGNELSSTPAAPASTTVIPTPAEAGEQMTMISESAQDAAAGTGASEVTVLYLDASGNEQETIVTLNGQTAVDLTPPAVRFVQDMYVSSLGSGNTSQVADGHIRIYKKSDATLVYNMIAAGGNKSMVPHRMVPTGKRLAMQGWVPCEAKNKRVAMRLRADCTPAYPGVRQANIPLFKSVAYLNQTTPGAMPVYAVIPALSIVKASGFADATLADFSVHWWGILVDD